MISKFFVPIVTMCVGTLNDADDETSLRQTVLFSATLFRYVAKINGGKKKDDQVFNFRFQNSTSFKFDNLSSFWFFLEFIHFNFFLGCDASRRGASERGRLRQTFRFSFSTSVFTQRWRSVDASHHSGFSAYVPGVPWIAGLCSQTSGKKI